MVLVDHVTGFCLASSEGHGIIVMVGPPGWWMSMLFDIIYYSYCKTNSPEQPVVPWPNSEQTNVPYLVIFTKRFRVKHYKALYKCCILLLLLLRSTKSTEPNPYHHYTLDNLEPYTTTGHGFVGCSRERGATGQLAGRNLVTWGIPSYGVCRNGFRFELLDYSSTNL